MNHSTEILFQPLQLGDTLNLKNRIVMAPMTRSMADAQLVPTEAMADYYARRAETGLVITEGTIIDPLAQGYPNTPGIYSEAQIEGWRRVTDQVHQSGGKIFCQIWHTGRVSHPIYLDGQPPMAPSAVALSGPVPRSEGLEYGMPRAMSEADIQQVIEQFARAAANAKQAGFDGVEIHAANGYLLDQFLHWETNQRSDRWGGSAEKMSRILFEVVEAVQQQISAVGVRLSPQGYLHIEPDPRDKTVFDFLLQRLNEYPLSYLHTGMFVDSVQEAFGGTITQYIRSHYQGTVIASGGYDAERGAETIRSGDADLVAIGRALIANPDYVARTRSGEPLVEYNDAMLGQLQ